MKRILILIVIMLLIPSVANAWRFGTLEVSQRTLLEGPLLLRGYYDQRYNGTTKTAFTVNYTGSGNNLFDFQGDGTSVFSMTKAGVLTLVGTLSATSLGLNDTDASNVLSLVWNENDSSDRTLNFLVASGNRSLTLNENFTIGGGFDFTLTAEDAAGSILLDNITAEIENGFATQRLFKLVQGTDAAATLTVEGGSGVVNQDTTNDASPTLANLTLGNNDDADPAITFDGDTSDGVLNYDEDNADFEFDQDVTTTGALAGATLNTGQGAYELFAMNQDVESTDTVTFDDTTIQGADPAIIFDPTTATDTEFYIAINEDAGGDDNDTFTIGKGIVKGTTPFITMDKDGGIIFQNLTDAVTGFKVMDADGGTSVLNVDTTNEQVEVTAIESTSGSGVSNRIPVTSPMMNYIPGAYYREADDDWQYEGTGAADQRYTLQSPARLLVDVDDTVYLISAQTDYDLSVAATWDTTGGTDYTVAANRAGVDFYIYAIQQAGTTPLIEISSNSSAPDGYTTANSRKIGGFHCLCVAVGAIGGHTLTGFLAGDILPMSVWDYDHRPVSTPEGMVYSEAMDVWVDIYLASGTGGSTVSVNGGTISDSRTWLDFNDDGAAVKKRLLWDMEFQSIAAGSNEETNNAASADPVTTGGNSDTAGRRMISNIGVEDACGAMWQWLLDTSYRYDAGDHTHTTTITHKGSATGSAVYKDAAETNFNAVLGSTADETVNTSNADPEPAWAYYDLPGAKGSFYRQGTYGTVQLRAGGRWDHGANAGSRARLASYWRWHTHTDIGGRFASEPR